MFDSPSCGFPWTIQPEVQPEKPDMVCFRCGLCCTKLRVFLSLEEAQRISKYTGFPLEVFLEERDNMYWFGQESFILRQRSGACFFLEYVAATRQARCLVHPVKPIACRQWSPSRYRHECQEGLTRYWQLTVNTAGELEGTEEKLRDFRTFLESLPS